MATIINVNDYFNGKLTIGQASDNNVDLLAYINEHEPVVLKNLLGYALYKDFVANIALQRHIDIRDGKEYTNRKGDLDKWVGLKFDSNGVKKSLIANYVYFRYQNQNATSRTTGTGEKTQEGENSKHESPRFKITGAWNEMVAWNKELREFLLSNIGTYSEYVDPLTLRREAMTDRRDLLEPCNPYV